MTSLIVICGVIAVFTPLSVLGRPLDKEIQNLRRRYETCLIGIVVPYKGDVAQKAVKEKEVLWARNRPQDESLWSYIGDVKAFPIGAQVVCLFDYDNYGAAAICLVNKDGTVALGKNIVIRVAELRKIVKRLQKAAQKPPPAPSTPRKVLRPKFSS